MNETNVNIEEQTEINDSPALPANGDVPISELVEEYKELKQKVNLMDMNNLSDENRETLMRYTEVKDFLDDIRNSLDFVKASTFVVGDENREKAECRSLLYSKEEYAELSAKLTNGFDDSFIKEVEKTRSEPLHPEPLTKQEYLASVSAPLRMASIAEELQDLQKPYTVAEVGEAVGKAKKEMEFNCIDENNVVNSTLDLYFAESERGKLTTLAQEEFTRIEKAPAQYAVTYKDEEGFNQTTHSNDWENVKLIAASLMIERGLDVMIEDTINNQSVELNADKYKENYNTADRLDGYFPVEANNLVDVDYENQHKPVEKPVEIVESNDGYVMAASEITPENEAEFNSRVNKANNEVIHNEAPQETTIDPAAVGGKVKLETVEDLGSKEIKSIESGVDLGSLNERYENSKYDETPDENEEYTKEQEEQEFDGYDDIVI